MNIVPSTSFIPVAAMIAYREIALTGRDCLTAQQGISQPFESKKGNLS